MLTFAGVSYAGFAQVDNFLWPRRATSSGRGDYENGVNAARAGDWQMSVRFLERSAGRDPQDADALTMLAFGNNQLGRLGPSHALLPRACRLPNYGPQFLTSSPEVS